jgi:hypothetical protein
MLSVKTREWLSGQIKELTNSSLNQFNRKIKKRICSSCEKIIKNPNILQTLRDLFNDLLVCIQPFYIVNAKSNLIQHIPKFLNRWIKPSENGWIDLDQLGSFVSTMHLHQVGEHNPETNEVHIIASTTLGQATPAQTQFEKLLVKLFIYAANEQRKRVTKEMISTLTRRCYTPVE